MNSFVREQMFLNVVFLRPRNQQRTKRKFSETPFRSPGESSALIDAPGDLNSVRASPYPVPARRTPHRVVNESLRAQALTPFTSSGESSARMVEKGDMNGVSASQPGWMHKETGKVSGP